MVCTLQGRNKSLASAENWTKIPKMSSPLLSHYSDYACWLAPTCIVPRCNLYTIFLLFPLTFPANTTLKWQEQFKSCPTYSSARNVHFCQAGIGQVIKEYPWRYKLQQCIVYSFKYNQQDATLYNILHYCQCAMCFRRFLRRSAGAQKLYSIGYMSSLHAATASVGEFQLTRTSGSSKQAWHIPDAVCTVFELLMMGGESAWNT